MNPRGPIAFVALMTVLAGAPASAQDTTEPDDERRPEVRLVVSELSTVLGPGTLPPDASDDRQRAADRVRLRVLVENTGPVAVDELRLSVEVFEAIRFRSTLRTALDLDSPRPRLGQLDSEFLPIRGGEALRPGDIAGVSFTTTATELGIARQRTAGVVFPLRLSVVEGIDPLDQATTSVIYLRDPVEEPLATVVGWPLNDEPWRRPGGTYAPRIDAKLRAGGRLDTLLRAAEAHRDLALTFLPGPHLLEDLVDRADGFTRMDGSGQPEPIAPEDPVAAQATRDVGRLRSLLGDAAVEPVVGAYADADVAALAQGPDPLDNEAASAVSRGRVRLAALAGRDPDTSTYWASTPLDQPTLDMLASQTAIERVLLPFEQLGYEGDLDSYPEDVPGALNELTTSSGRRILALVPDPYVDRQLRAPDRSHGPIVAAQRVLAETAVLWTELPLTRRPLVVLPPRDWEPLGRYASHVLDAFASAPWLKLSAPADLAALAPDRDTSVRIAERAGSLTDPFLSAILAARQDLAAVQRALPADAEGVADRPVEELERQLLRAPSVWFGSGSRGRALIADVHDAVDRAYGKVEVAEGARITLTSDNGQIPVTIQRPAGGPLDVLISIEEARANLQWPEGQVKRVTLPGTGAQTYSFAVQARSTGSFGVTVTVTDPDRFRELARGTVTIRSTAISGPALAGTALVVILLLLMGVFRRRPDRPKLEVVG